MSSFAVASPSLCSWRMALVHIISLNRKFSYTTKLFSGLFPLGHWGEATVTPVSEHISSYYSTTAPKHQNERPSRCMLLIAFLKVPSRVSALYSETSFFNNLKENALWNVLVQISLTRSEVIGGECADKAVQKIFSGYLGWNVIFHLFPPLYI